MVDTEREAFQRGFRDYKTSALLKNRWTATGCTSPLTQAWRPSEGHEEAYAAGWERARLQALEEGSKQKVA